MATRIPPLLDPYLSLPPEASLIVFTSVLGASTNWLVLRHLHALLLPASSPNDAGYDRGEGAVREDGTAVVLASFMRDFAFWRDGAARLGLDLEALGRRGRFVFADGLGGAAAAAGAVPGWMVAVGAAAAAPGEKTPEGVGRAIGRVVDGLRAAGRERVVLVVDQVDLLVAFAGADGEGAGREVREMMLGLREVHATIMTLSADEPLVSSQTTTLEKEHAALVLSAAHEAEMVVSLRLLDTGTAKDVSGVLRITRGGAESDRPVEEKEYLYHVGGDGGVRVFERGQ